MGWLSLYSVLCLHLFLYHSLSSCFAFPSCRIDQSSALLDFKNSFSVSKPDRSDDSNLFCFIVYKSVTHPKTSSWENGTNCCKWDGVTCNALGYIIGLNLECSLLQGKLLPNNSLFKLTHLQRLDLSVNDFQRSHISPNFAQLVSLTHLHLFFSNFSGEVPSHISHLQKLVSLDLSYNVDHFAFINDQYYYCLSLKPNTWERLVQNLTDIMELHLSKIDMSLIPPSQLLNLSTSLVSLRLGSTRLQGNLEDKIFCFPHLEEIYLSRNINLTGYLPKSNGSNSLRVLYLSDTSLTGELPHSIGHMKLLNVLDLSSCQFVGEIPPSLSNLTQLAYLDLSDNSFAGELPHSIGHMKLLNELDLSSCQFVGEIPPSLWNLTQLATLDLSDNNFSGQISSSLSNLQNLTFLDLSSNNFDGHLPDEISGFSNLWRLDLSHNLLNGTIPFWFFSLPSLKDLDVSSNQFTSQIGEISSYSLEWFDVSNNKLYGSIPRSTFYLQKLKLLNLSHNSLTGVVQLHHLSWTEMHSIDFSSNLLQGEVSSSICNASSLEILNLSHNNFTGTIPQCFGSSSLALSVLDLQNNSFSGTIPETFEVDNNLRTLNLNGNQLKGSLPKSLVNCTNLKVLDLGKNGIEDTFPHWLQVLEELQVLVLRENKLHGSIPNFNDKANHAFPKLRVFDLSSNNLSGPLPTAYIKSFEAMKNIDGETGLEYIMSYGNYSGSLYQDSIEVTLKGLEIHLEKILTIFTTIDLSNNMFEGVIPKVIGELGALKGLNFSHNRLTGAIPSSIGNLRNLEWLDLSSNMITGKIPPNLTNLNFLSVLNLSQNQLEGCIPRGQQFETFTGDSFKGNNGIRGFPLSTPCINHEESHPPIPSSSFEVGIEFGWKPVLLGYASGAAFGATMFWVVTLTGKPRWMASMVNDLSSKRKRRVRNCRT